MYEICYWDSDSQSMKVRAATAAEAAEIDARKSVAPPVIPQSVPMLNAHLALISAGWMPGVREYLDSLQDDAGLMARAYFEKALTVRRDHPLVQAISVALNKTSAEVDSLFITAAGMNL